MFFVLLLLIFLIWLISDRLRFFGMKLVLMFWILCGVGLIFLLVRVWLIIGEVIGFIVMVRIGLFWVFLM